MTTLSPEQTIRRQRAQEQAQDYIITPHWTDVDAFTVISKRHGGSYDVSPAGCSCPDATRRSEGKCKHWHLVRAHVAELVGHEPKPAPVQPARATVTPEQRESLRRQMAQDFPDY